MYSNEITENLFAAIDVIVDKKLSELSFNRTIVVEVLEKLDEHNYQVKYQNSKFNVYSPSIYDYKVNETAYVLVINNDINKDKFLIGPTAYYQTKKR